MTHRVRLAPKPIVVDVDGEPVADALVLEISFPGDTVVTPAGRMNVVIGAGSAKIMVGGKTLRGISLC
jgi:hypothetical protein